MQEIKRANRRSHALVHFVTDRTSLFTVQKISGQPIRARFKHFTTICEHTSDNSPTGSSSSFCEFIFCSIVNPEQTHKREQLGKDVKLCTAALSFSSPIRSIFQRILEHVLPCRRTTQPFLREACPTPVIFSVASTEIRDSNIFVYRFINVS